MKERCFVMIKPGILNRRIVGEIISRIERKGPNLIGTKMMMVSTGLAEQHYGEHKGRPFFEGLIEYITSGPVIATVWEADDCCPLIRKLVGVTEALEAQSGTIRGDFCIHTNRNVIHASDKAESAEREIALFFKPEELCQWEDEFSGKWI